MRQIFFAHCVIIEKIFLLRSAIIAITLQSRGDTRRDSNYSRVHDPVNTRTRLRRADQTEFRILPERCTRSGCEKKLYLGARGVGR